MEIARVQMLIGEGRRRGVGLSDREALPEHIPRAEQAAPPRRGAGPGARLEQPRDRAAAPRVMPGTQPLARPPLRPLIPAGAAPGSTGSSDHPCRA